MKIEGVFFESQKNFSWLITIKDRFSICIDPTSGEKVYNSLGNEVLKYIINTHEHGDHTGGNQYLKKETGAEVLAYEGIIDRIPGGDRGLKHGEVIPLEEGYSLEVVHTPGHTPNHICLQLMEHQNPIGIFSGDTLFNAGVGNCHSGDPEALYESITKCIGTLPGDVSVYPGHNYLETNLKFTLNIEPENKDAKDILKRYKAGERVGIVPSSLEMERKVNTFLRANNKKDFIRLRELRNNW